MNIIKTEIEGLLIIEPKVFADDRGYFFEFFSEREFRKETGFDIHFVQDNESKSDKGVLRGIHFQKPPYAQAKLVRVVKGSVQDVVVDIRAGSSTFGKSFSVVLTGDKKNSLFIPAGFAHAFLVLEDDTIFQYKCSEFYSPEHEGAILWSDPKLGIDWMLPEIDYIISEKDQKAQPLSL